MRPSLILGSSSPRRLQLLEAMQLKFGVVKPLTEERPRPGEAALAYALRNAAEKGEWTEAQFRLGKLDAELREGREQAIILSADTIVVLDGAIIEKPINIADAEQILARLSGRSHTVISGVSLLQVERTRGVVLTEQFAVETQVWFKQLSAHEIASYVASGEPMDKAGAYAMQGLGSFLVTRIEGSYSNVIGLPVAEVIEKLASRFAYSIWRK